MPRAEIESSPTQLFAQRLRPGRVVSEADIFGPTSELVGTGVSKAGRPCLPIRAMAALLYLKHAYNGGRLAAAQPRHSTGRACRVAAAR